jgi:hypothetical protein
MESPVATWPGEEIECKVDMSHAHEKSRLVLVQSVFQIPEVLVSRQPRRSERHHAYTSGDVRTILTCAKEVWVKRKRNTRIISTPKGTPFLQREEVLTDPSKSDYQQLLVDTLNMTYVGSFQKEMVDIWIWYRDFHFTMTLADAMSKNGTLTQIEFEYDGHHPNGQSPSLEEVLTRFDELVAGVPSLSPSSFTTQTKFDWLVQ